MALKTNSMKCISLTLIYTNQHRRSIEPSLAADAQVTKSELKRQYKQTSHPQSCEIVQKKKKLKWFTEFCLSIFKTANRFPQLTIAKSLFIKLILETTQNHLDLKYLLSGFAGTDTLLEMPPVRNP